MWLYHYISNLSSYYSHLLNLETCCRVVYESSLGFIRLGGANDPVRGSVYSGVLCVFSVLPSQRVHHQASWLTSYAAKVLGRESAEIPIFFGCVFKPINVLLFSIIRYTCLPIASPSQLHEGLLSVTLSQFQHESHLQHRLCFTTGLSHYQPCCPPGWYWPYPNSQRCYPCVNSRRSDQNLPCYQRSRRLPHRTVEIVPSCFRLSKWVDYLSQVQGHRRRRDSRFFVSAYFIWDSSVLRPELRHLADVHQQDLGLDRSWLFRPLQHDKFRVRR